MSHFKFPMDCIVEKSAKAIVDELLKGSYIIVADLTPEILLQNVFTLEQKKAGI